MSLPPLRNRSDTRGRVCGPGKRARRRISGVISEAIGGGRLARQHASASARTRSSWAPARAPNVHRPLSLTCARKSWSSPMSAGVSGRSLWMSSRLSCNKDCTRETNVSFGTW
jgi:hypothetical protein